MDFPVSDHNNRACIAVGRVSRRHIAITTKKIILVWNVKYRLCWYYDFFYHRLVMNRERILLQSYTD